MPPALIGLGPRQFACFRPDFKSTMKGRGYAVNKEKKREGKQIEQMGKSVLANLSIEELEQRLEMQILSLPIALNSCKTDCDGHCGTFCSPIAIEA
jgi:hypothetical protein